MSFPMLSTVVVVFGLFSAFEVSATAQSPTDPPSTQQPVYTLHANKRVVLTDVTVTDRKGNPIHGLDASAFRISDNGKPQDLASFEVHSGPPVESVPADPTKPSVYSNDFLQHPPPVFNVLLIDLATISLPVQMSLYYELTQFLKHLQASEPLAIYLRWGTNVMLVQDFTSDHALLLAAVQRALPRFQSPEQERLTEVELLHQIAVSPKWGDQGDERDTGPSIVFQAHVVPASNPSLTPPKKGPIPYTIRYTLPLDKFVMQNVAGKQQASMGIASMVFDGNGRSTAKRTEEVTATFTKEELCAAGQHVYTFEQPIDLKNGENYLYLGVWDVNTGQFGTIQLSLDAAHPKSADKGVKN